MRRRSSSPFASLLVLVLCSARLLACQLDPPAAAGPAPGARPASTHAPSATDAPAAPFAASSDAGLSALAPLAARLVVTWNLQWFLDPARGPDDDARQLAGARSALMALTPDLLALQELSSGAALDALLDGTPLHVAAISAFDWPQQIAIVCSDRLEPVASRVLEALTSAGRAPLEVELRDRQSGARVVAIAVHAKAYADAESFRARLSQAEGLHAYLQGQWPDAAVIVLGDLNDGLERSITSGEPSPYAAFVEDPRWSSPTRALELAQPERRLLDHVLVSDELAARVRPDAAERLDLRQLAAESSPSAVSDHAPIRVRLDGLDR